MLHSYYFDTANEYLEYQVNTVKDAFSVYASAGATEFEKGAKEYVESFALHD